MRSGDDAHVMRVMADASLGAKAAGDPAVRSLSESFRTIGAAQPAVRLRALPPSAAAAPRRSATNGSTAARAASPAAPTPASRATQPRPPTVHQT
jgi:hypothetical protein